MNTSRTCSKVAQIELHCTDLEQAKKFYCDSLGLRLVGELDNSIFVQCGEVNLIARARSRRTQVNADYVLKRLHDEAEADLADIYEKDGWLKPVDEWPEIWRSGLVASVETSITPDGTRVDKVRLSDRTEIGD